MEAVLSPSSIGPPMTPWWNAFFSVTRLLQYKVKKNHIKLHARQLHGAQGKPLLAF